LGAFWFASNASAVTEQTGSDVFNGRSYLYLEAESFSSLGADPEGDGWEIMSKETPITSTGGLDILPANSNVSGTALLDQIGGGQHADTAVYEVQFMTAGTYQFYSRHTMFDSDGNNNFGNEDSVFVSPAFDKNSSSDWVGFEGLEFDENDINVDIPTPGFALDPDGFKPGTGNTENEGWHAIRDWRIKSAGVILGSSSQDPSLQNGKFHWYNRPAYVSSGAGGGFDSDYGFKTEFIVTPEQVGNVVTFEIGTRENYAVFDGFLFIQETDDIPTLLDDFSQEEVDGIIPHTEIIGDYDDSGQVGQSDLNLVLQNWGSTSPPVPTGWINEQPAGLIGQNQLNGVLQNWGNSAVASVGAVPEPTSLALFGLALTIGVAGRRRK
jgi:hypothetical protein